MDAVYTPNLESIARCFTPSGIRASSKPGTIQFVERLCRSVKYEEVYLFAYDSVNAAKNGLAKYFTRYNQHRPHSSLDDKTPDEFYFENLPTMPKAA